MRCSPSAKSWASAQLAEGLVADAPRVDRTAHISRTKQATLSFAEWLAANYRARGIRVSCFCPGPMDTPMLRASGLPAGHSAFGRALSGEQVAELLVRGLRAEKFLIDDSGPVDGTRAFAQKVDDYDGWLAAMSRPYA